MRAVSPEHQSPASGGRDLVGAAEIGTISLGSLEVVVESEAPGLVGALQSIYSGAAAPRRHDGHLGGPPQRAIVYRVVRETLGNGLSASYSVLRDGEALFQNYAEGGLVNCLEWDISGAASRALIGYHRIHAGAVAYNGSGILLPGASGAGKSTTVAALALAGFTYCSDELALVGPDFRLYPFPKIISLKPGGWWQIARDFPEAVAASGWPTVASGGVWQVTPPLVPAGPVAREGYPVDFVILPRYRPGEESRLAPIPRSWALKELVEQSLDLQLWRSEGFEVLVELVGRARCYCLSVGSLKEAAVQVKGLTL